MSGIQSFAGLLILILDIIALVDIYKRPMDITKKLLWVLVILVFPVVGMVLYFILNKKAPV